MGHKEEESDAGVDDGDSIDQVSFKDFDQWKIKKQSPSFSETEIDFLWKLHVLLHNIDPMRGISLRSLVKMDLYLKNIPIDNDDTIKIRSQALDKQLIQRVLSKVKGSEEQLRNIFGNGETDGEMIALLNEYKDISEFNNIRAKVMQLSKELSYHGYIL